MKKWVKIFTFPYSQGEGLDWFRFYMVLPFRHLVHSRPLSVPSNLRGKKLILTLKLAQLVQNTLDLGHSAQFHQLGKSLALSLSLQFLIFIPQDSHSPADPPSQLGAGLTW